MIERRDADLSGSKFRDVDLSRSEFRSVFFRHVTITDAWLEDVRIEGKVVSLTVNGVDVTAFVDAELDRRHPDRLGLRANDVEGLREAWSAAIARADDAIDRARRLPPRLLDVRVNDEYSFIETLRHLVFGMDRWVTGPVFAAPEPYFHRLGKPHDGADEGLSQGLDLDAEPSLDEVLDVRRDQQRRMQDYLSNATEDELRRPVESPNGGATTVLHCLHVVLNEEWWHHQYAARDLAVLEARPADRPDDTTSEPDT